MLFRPSDTFLIEFHVQHAGMGAAIMKACINSEISCSTDPNMHLGLSV